MGSRNAMARPAETRPRKVSRLVTPSDQTMATQSAPTVKAM